MRTRGRFCWRVRASRIVRRLFRFPPPAPSTRYSAVLRAGPWLGGARFRLERAQACPHACAYRAYRAIRSNIFYCVSRIARYEKNKRLLPYLFLILLVSRDTRYAIENTTAHRAIRAIRASFWASLRRGTCHKNAVKFVLRYAPRNVFAVLQISVSAAETAVRTSFGLQCGSQC